MWPPSVPEVAPPPDLPEIPEMVYTTDDVFDDAWYLLEYSGKCDAKGGMQYQRIAGEWESQERELMAALFIAMRANDMSFEQAVKCVAEAVIRLPEDE